jgi:hypothetical protein
MYQSGDSKFHPTSLSLASGNISDVNIVSPSLNQVLKYDGTNWVNGASSGGVSTLAALTDCDINSTTPL